ncbi:serine hydrolase domain-containing protein [Cerasicoccus fimbriatus]|uniref:serine hydrolase domain-containing protein n=1 Tax=Cerasicoccus fimbriatus TaxID=3014554 RepID=UPI0022B2C049|nr:serine hydrolase domain-containing protein [Cerasicoccus sp. TK19100]
MTLTSLIRLTPLLILPTLAQADLASDIYDIAAAHQDAQGVPGMIVGVWQGDSAITTFARGVGNLDTSAPITTSDHTRIGSVTKSFTVTRLLQLVDNGQVSLDDPISKYLPTIENGSATLRQLANMTSGIYNYTADGAFVNELFNDLTREWAPQELVDVADRNGANFAPGAQWQYSNTNTVALGMVIEQVTGNTLAHEINTNVLAPLGLDNTLYPVTVDIPDPFSRGYGVFDSEVGYEDITTSSPSSSAGSGAMVADMEDLRIWAEALAYGTLLSPEIQAERLQMIDLSGGGDGPEYDAYGLGIGEIDGFLGHTGDYLGYQALALYDKDTDQTVVILTNLLSGEHIPTDIFRDIAPLLIPEPAHYALMFGGVLLGALVWRRRGR